MQKNKALKSLAGFSSWVLGAGGVYVVASLFFCIKYVRRYADFLTHALPEQIFRPDFTSFYAAARAYWVLGLNPYAESGHAAVVAAQPLMQAGYDYLPFVYNPFSLLVLCPLGALTYGQASVVAAVICGVLLAASVWVLQRVLTAYLPSVWLSWLVAALTLCQEATYLLLLNGQVFNLLILVAVLLCVWQYQRQGRIPAALWVVSLVILSVKVQFVALLFPFFMLASGRGRLLGVLAGIGIGLLGLYVIVAPSLFAYYLEALGGKATDIMAFAVNRITNISLSALAGRWAVMAGLAGVGPALERDTWMLLFYGLALGVLALLLRRIWVLRHAVPLPALWLPMAGWVISLGPLSWLHYMAILAPLFVLYVVAHPREWLSALLLVYYTLFLYLQHGFKGFDAPLPAVVDAATGLSWWATTAAPPLLTALLAALSFVPLVLARPKSAGIDPLYEVGRAG
jgi:Glycosyltransferase family 87